MKRRAADTPGGPELTAESGAHEHRSTRLRDGRVIGWAEFGDPAGRPVVYCHGFPSSRLEARIAAVAAARGHVRLIAPDRPGAGLSSAAFDRQIADWPNDLEELMDLLGARRFAVLGVSGGGPYAVACARALPTRVEAVALVGALAPLAASGSEVGMSGLARLSIRLARRHPWALAVLFHGLGALIQRWPRQVFRITAPVAPRADREVFAHADTRAVWSCAMRASVSQGARPAVHQLRCYTRPWGFAPADVRVPVRLWHGTADSVVPVAQGRLLARELPRVEARFLPGEGHFSLPVKHIEAILGDLPTHEYD